MTPLQTLEDAPVLAAERPVAARPRVGFVSLGCPKNLVDSEVMMGLLDRAGAELTTSPETAEILVVNTCSFIDSAKQESVDTILEMAQHKTTGRARKLIVAGCLVERYRDEIRKNIPEVDAVVGTGELEMVLEAAGLAAFRAPATPALVQIGLGQNGRPRIGRAQVGMAPVGLSMHPIESDAAVVTNATSRAEGDLRERQGRFARASWEGATAMLPSALYDETMPRILTTGKTSAYLKIAEGCDHPCSFCVIPNLRGKFRSRRFESVVAEAEQLVARGVREITLIGQDTTCYGEDLGLRDGLAALLDRLAKIEGLTWLRFLYAYPNKITGRLLETIAKHDRIVKYMDVPLQHVSGNVLKSMRRGANAEIFLKTLDKVRTAVPGIALRTSFIVGFPGETAEDHAALLEFVRAAKFDWMGAFSYSDEEGAHAFGYDKATKVPKRTIEARRRSLMKLQQTISRERKQQWVGRTMDVLVEGESKETPLLWEGRSQFHAPEIDGTVYINDFGPHEALVPGSFYQCEITEAHDYDVVARVVG
ncbi:MAG: 30S ribosomal protein S12 methylthiotransferase RimO [Acidobacteriaceae bacterium]